MTCETEDQINEFEVVRPISQQLRLMTASQWKYDLQKGVWVDEEGKSTVRKVIDSSGTRYEMNSGDGWEPVPLEKPTKRPPRQKDLKKEYACEYDLTARKEGTLVDVRKRPYFRSENGPIPLLALIQKLHSSLVGLLPLEAVHEIDIIESLAIRLSHWSKSEKAWWKEYDNMVLAMLKQVIKEYIWVRGGYKDPSELNT